MRAGLARSRFWPTILLLIQRALYAQAPTFWSIAVLPKRSLSPQKTGISAYHCRWLQLARHDSSAHRHQR